MAIIPSPKIFLLLLAFFFSHAIPAKSSNASTTTTLHANLSSSNRTNPFPEVSSFNSSKLSISININPYIINTLLNSLQAAISGATKLSDLSTNAGNNIIDNKIGAVQDCRELQQSTLASLKRSLSGIRSQDSKKLVDARTYLSAALTNKDTCLESIDSASGTLKPVVVNSVISSYKDVSESLSMLPKPERKASKGHKNRRLLWLSMKNRRRLLQSNDGGELVVAADGTGNFSFITEAINFAPNDSAGRTVIYVKEGTYEENVEIPSYKTNIVLFGDGKDVTVITGNRSVVDGWTTFRSATLSKPFMDGTINVPYVITFRIDHFDFVY